MRINLYFGKENGLMVIGSEEELRKLGQSISGLEGQVSKDWPKLIAEFPSDTDDFKLSFHVEDNTKRLPSNFPSRSTLARKIFYLAVYGLALVGLVSIFK